LGSDAGVIVRAIDRFLEASRASDRDAQVRSIENPLAKQLRTGWRKQGKAFLSALGGIRDQFPAQESWRLREAVGDAWQPIWSDSSAAGDPTMEGALNSGAEDAYLAGAVATEASLGLSTGFNLSNPLAVRYLDKYAADLVSNIDDTTRDTLNRLITGGVQEGLSYQKIAATLRDQFDNWSEPQAHILDRAEMVAVTEVGNAYESGSRAVVQDLQDSGLEYEKSWLAEGDACPICEANAEQDWIPADDAFDSGDDTPTAHPACRCTTLYQRINSDGSTTDEGDSGSGE